MKRSVRNGLIVAAALAAAGAVVPIVTTSASAAGSLTATFTVDQDWGSGWGATYKITNGTASTVNGWTLEFDLPAGGSITSFWDADVTHTGQHYVAKNKSWAPTVAAGASFSWGMNGAGAKPPLNCTINGLSCSGGGTPTTAPPTTTKPPTSNPPTSQPPTSKPPTSTPPTTSTPPSTGSKKVVAYFTEWGVYGRNYQVKNVETSGSASKLTHILYAFGNTTGGQCSIGDSYADYDKAYTADQSVDGVADTWDQPLRGNFNQLKKLKAMHPGLKVIWSFGGWTWSAGFTQAAQNPTAFANSCYNLVNDPRWAGVFDGIDIDWEYPNACGLQCDASGPNSFKSVVAALRAKFGASKLVTAAITADGSNGGKIDLADYAGAVSNLDWIDPMTYDYFGAFNAQGPTAPHSPLTCYSGIPQAGFCADAAIQKLKSKGIPSSKLLLGIGFYGRGWTGVTQAAPGGSASGGAPGTYETGIEDYKVLKNTCPATSTVGGTAYALCGNNWWSYDTPSTISGKMTYAKQQSLGGAFVWELSGDTTNGELITAVSGGLR
jgi:chitinase